jgi:mono/diheme cytochrome c family protein
MLRFCSLTLMILFGALVLSAGPAYAQADGAKVYAAQKCSMCHSIAGVGNKKLPLDGVGTKLTADQIREWIVTPAEAAKKASSTAKPAMRAYPALPKADLDALVGYMKSLTK